MSGIKVPVSATADRSLSAVFEPLVESSRRARARIKSDAERAAAEEAKAAQKAAAAASKAFAQIEAASAKAAAKEIADADRAAQAKVRAEQRAFDVRIRMAERAQREAKRTADAEEREIMRTARSAENRERNALAIARRDDARKTGDRRMAVATGAYQTFTGIAGAAMGGAGSIARGAGVDLSIERGVAKAVDLEKKATDLSASAFIKGATGAQGIRVEPGEIEKTARAVGDLAAYDPGKVIEGLQKFVGKTGDLATGNAALANMARLARATGSELEDVVDAAGDVSANLGDAIPAGAEKAKVVGRIMQMIAGQGKIGAVEMKDLAVQMAKLAASATSFEGDRAGVMGQMGAFAQMSRAMGGAASATQAATSVAALVNTFKTPARMEAFKEATGKTVYNEQTGMLRDPKTLLIEALEATKGDPAAFKKIFANVQGARAVEGFATVFREARGKALESGKAPEEATKVGLEAVTAKFAEFEKAAVSNEQIAEDFGRAMKTTGARAQVFQNQLDKAVADMASTVLPQLAKAAPDLLQLVSFGGKLAAVAAENPGAAVTAAIVGSIAKAAIGNAIGEALKAQVLKAGLGMTGAIGLIAAEVALIVGQFQAMRSGAKEGGAAALTTSRTAYDVAQEIKAKEARGEKLTSEDLAKLSEQKEMLAQQATKAGVGEEYAGATGTIKGIFDSIMGNRTYREQFEATQAKELKQLDSATSADIDRLINAITSQGIKVTIDPTAGSAPAAARGTPQGGAG